MKSIFLLTTATLVLQEVEKGSIDLKTPIRKYLPDFKFTWADTVTVHHLLNNTSGLWSENMDKPLNSIRERLSVIPTLAITLQDLFLKSKVGRALKNW